MKINFVIYSLGAGGAERAVTGLANYWAGQHTVNIITLVKCESFYTLDKSVRLRYCLEQPQTKNSLGKSILNAAKRLRRLIKHLKKDQPQVVLSFMHTSNIYAIWACRRLGIPCIVSERANHAVDQLTRLQQWLRNLSYPQAACLVVQTQGNKAYYEKIKAINNIAIIPNAVAPSLVSLHKDLQRASEKLILNVGSFKPGKAQDLLIRAFAQLPSNEWNLVFLGKGKNLQKFKALAQELGVAERVIFEGAQKDVAAYYIRAGMFVFTSEHEGFPNALLEALYFGLPSISTNCPFGPADMITDGKNGFLVPVGNIKALATKINLLMNNESLQESFRQKAMESTEKYEMETIAAQWIQLIQEVV